MNSIKHSILFFGAVLFAGSFLIAQTPKTEARDSLNKGVNAFRIGNYAAAAEYFRQATSLDPDLMTAQVYLATAYAQQYIPGGLSRENQAAADNAIDAFKGVLRRDPDNLQAVMGLASIYQNSKDLQNAGEAYRTATKLDPLNPVAFYAIGSIDWMIVYDKEHPQSHSEKDRLIAAGLESLKSAIALSPNYDDAMTYINLLYREKAQLAPDPVEKSRLLALADDWFNKSLETRKRNQTDRARGGPPPQ